MATYFSKHDFTSVIRKATLKEFVYNKQIYRQATYDIKIESFINNVHNSCYEVNS